MDLYSTKGKSLPQKLLVSLIELGLIALSIYIMFGAGAQWFAGLSGFSTLAGTPDRRWIILIFSLITLARFTFMMFYLLKRKMPWSEVVSVPAAFSLYYVGFAILVLPNQNAIGIWDIFGIAVFLFGGFLNTYSELQRNWFKKDNANKGKLFTSGLFAYSLHINFFGDVLWVAGYAIIAGHLLGIAIVMLLLGFFMFGNIPMLDTYLRQKYGEAFVAYEAETKRLIPFIW